MKKLTLLAGLICLSITTLLAQPANDDCAGATVITDVTSFCSNPGAFTTVGATPSGFGPAACFNGSGNDVWFAFTAVATDVNITVRGNTAASPGGSLNNPQVSLYFGSCSGTINELECQNGPGTNVSESYQGGLFVGSVYLVRVQGANDGTFQLCINNYNPPVDPKSDCPKASILCDKSSFVVQNVTGAGSNITELNDAACFDNGAPTNYESNSTWFVWECSQSGTLEFTLTPNNGPDDLDFVLYRLPNGIGNCTGKQVVRCMASGQSMGVNSAPCLGPTGLRAGDSDTSEDAGCSDNGDNAWLAPFDMVAGETYALCVNNFSTTGNGFGVEFGGTGLFRGPEAKFTTMPPAICLDAAVDIIDASTFALGSITGWAWSFGADAQPSTATGKGPHNVKFTTPGTKPVVMTVTTDLGCKVTDIQNVIVFPDVEVDTVIAAPDCNGGTNGAIEITNIKSGTAPYQFSWNNGPFSSSNTLTGLTVGTYSLVIRDANNCETDLDINVKELELTVSPVVEKPLCTGDANGVITLNVTNGQAPYQFNWGSGFINSNTQGGFSAGAYTILGVDAELCKGTFMVTITDNPPVTLEVQKTDISCYGADDGTGTALAAGGVGNFSYSWSDNQTVMQAVNLPPGAYTVTIRDANDCSQTGAITITEPPELFIDLVGTKDLLCNGIPSGEITVSATGGRPGYEYSPEGEDYFVSPILTGLPAGDYWVRVRDASGCIDSVMATLLQPPPVTVVAYPQDTLIDLGFPIQINTATGPAGRPVTFLWTPEIGLDCIDCPKPLLIATDNYAYIVKVTDVDGCMGLDTVNVRVNKQRPVYFPNVFMPDTGVYPNTAFTGFSGPAAEQINILRVYDRWGSLIFERKNFSLNDPNLGWDGTTASGKDAESGVYTWYANVLFIDGRSLEFDGSVTVVR